MNRYHLALLAVIAAIIILLFYAWPAHAATAPVFAAPSISCPENSVNCSLIINKSAPAKSYSKITIHTVDGTAKVGTDYLAVDKTITIANSTLRTLVYIPVLDNATYQGSRTFAVALICVRYCQIAGSTTVTITDNEMAPPPPPAPTPTPTGSWTPTGGAPQIGGYAFVKGSNPTRQCCNGLIVKITGRWLDLNGSALDMWSTVYAADTSGNFPASNPYWAAKEGGLGTENIIPVAP